MKDNEKMLEKGSYGKLLANLCIPTVIIMLVMVIYNMADTFFIGQTGDPNKLAAVSLCAPLFTILSGFGTLFGNGGCTLISISLGEKATDRVKAATGFCVVGSVVVSLVVMAVVLVLAEPIALAMGATENTLGFAVTYLRIFAAGAPAVLFGGTFCNIIRADGSAAKSMAANLLGTITNIVLDALFILAFGWGVAGAAIATVIGNVLTSVYLIGYVRKSELLTLSPKYFFKDKTIAVKVITLGLPMACSTLIMSVSSIISNHMMISYGEVALAAQGVAGKIGMLIGMLAMGICMGLQPAISFAYGRKNLKRVFYIVKRTAVFNFLLGTSLAVLGFIFRNQIIHMFIDNKEVIQYGSIMIFGALLAGPFSGLYQLCQTFLQSTGKSDYATLVALLDKGIFYLPILFIMAKVFGLYGIAFASSVTTLFSLAAGLFFSVRWYKSWRNQA